MAVLLPFLSSKCFLSSPKLLADGTDGSITIVVDRENNVIDHRMRNEDKSRQSIRLTHSAVVLGSPSSHAAMVEMVGCITMLLQSVGWRERQRGELLASFTGNC